MIPPVKPSQTKAATDFSKAGQSHFGDGCGPGRVSIQCLLTGHYAVAAAVVVAVVEMGKNQNRARTNRTRTEVLSRNKPNKPYLQWSNYGGARGGLAHLKDLAAPAKHLF